VWSENILPETKENVSGNEVRLGDSYESVRNRSHVCGAAEIAVGTRGVLVGILVHQRSTLNATGQDSWPMKSLEE